MTKKKLKECKREETRMSLNFMVFLFVLSENQNLQIILKKNTKVLILKIIEFFELNFKNWQSYSFMNNFFR